MNGTKNISVFIDESGSFDPDRQSSRYYFVCMVFHNQDVNIQRDIQTLENSFESMGLPSSLCVHAGPIIRRENEYALIERETRRGIFRRMFLFVHNADIAYKCFKIDKNFLGGAQNLHDPLLLQMVEFLISNVSIFNSFEKINVYYDNGQQDLTRLLKEAFAIFASRTEFIPEVEPAKYRLFQAADIICTLELARAKLSTPEGLSESERTFFGGEKNLKKNYLKLLDRKIFH